MTQKPLLHLPVDFRQRDDVRTLSRLLAGELGARAEVLVCGLVAGLWLDWARGSDWRPLQCAVLPDTAEGWAQENITHLIEGACGWDGVRGRLLHLCIIAGTLRIDRREELAGLTLVDFALYNPHLLPGFVSRESKGGLIKAEKQRIREALVAAAQQEKLALAQGVELFAADVDPAERQRALALVMQLDAACGRAMRASAEYQADTALLRDAVAILRRTTPDDLLAVQRYVIRRRAMPDAVSDAAPVIRAFVDFLRKAKE